MTIVTLGVIQVLGQQPVVHAAYPASGPVPAAYSAQPPRTNDVRGSRNMNATGRPSLDYDGRRQSAGIKEKTAITTRAEITTEVIGIEETTD